MGTFAIINSAGSIINRIALDHAEGWPAPSGCTLVDDTASPMQVGGTFIGDVYTPPAPPPTGPIFQRQLRAVTVAQARLTITADDIQGVETSVGIGGAMALDTNVFWIFFSSSQPDDNFIAFVQARGNGGGRVNADVTGAFVDYIEVTTTDMAGNPVAPISLILSVQRAF